MRCFNVSQSPRAILPLLIAHCLFKALSDLFLLFSRFLQDCNNHGICMPMKFLAERAGRIYTEPWDAMKIWGCACDVGYRGPDCSLKVRSLALAPPLPRPPPFAVDFLFVSLTATSPSPPPSPPPRNANPERIHLAALEMRQEEIAQVVASVTMKREIASVFRDFMAWRATSSPFSFDLRTFLVCVCLYRVCRPSWPLYISFCIKTNLQAKCTWGAAAKDFLQPCLSLPSIHSSQSRCPDSGSLESIR